MTHVLQQQTVIADCGQAIGKTQGFLNPFTKHSTNNGLVVGTLKNE